MLSAKRYPLKLSDFDYDLPKELIAQEANPKRSGARLLVFHRENKEIDHCYFSNLLDYLVAGDVLVLNNTKVLPARLFGKKESGGIIEVLLLKEERKNFWEALLKPSGRVKENQILTFSDKGIEMKAKVLDSADGVTGIRHIEFLNSKDSRVELDKIGRMPLPPYINRPDSEIDRELYQTVFAKKLGAIASPTAGLHFDQELLNKIEAKGVQIGFVTLHVSYGTFHPVTHENIEEHEMHEEYFEIPDETAELINFAKTAGRRVIACGTTVVRTLESAAKDSLPCEVEAKSGMTNIFIYPPYEFKIVDAMITNFHLPKTTLLMLVSAFFGIENLKRAYREAIQNRYRFYSYGDAMLII